MAYTKLFTSLITSTVWMEDDATRIVWITMLALADKNGEVQGSVPGLARMAGVSVEACDAALAKFMAPDPRSRTKSDEGRRVEEIDGGWLLLNHAKYRRMASLDDQREKTAERVRRFRERRNADVTPSNACVTEHYAPVTVEPDKQTQTQTQKQKAEEDSEKDYDHSVASAPPMPGKRGTRLKDDYSLSIGLRAFASDLGLDPDNARDEFVDYWTSVPGSRGLKLDWDKTFKNRCRELGKKTNGPPIGETFNQRRIREGMAAILGDGK